MKLYIKQKVFTIGEAFEVRNEFNEIVYYVKGSFFRLPKKFVIYDANHIEVASAESELFRFMARYQIHTHNESIVLKRNFTFFWHSFQLMGTDWTLTGDFFSHEYQVVSGTRPIMTLSKHWFTWGDSYELNIENDNDALLCLAIVVAIDAEIMKDRSSN